jgi:hypothetical protein
MGRQRFARLRYASQLTAAQLDRYRAVRSGTVAIVRGDQPSRPTTNIQITPFGFQLASTAKAKLKVTTRSRAAIGTEVGTRAVAVTADGTRVPGFVPAKVIAFIGTGVSTQRTSDITLRTYEARGGESYTHPFGGATATERENEAFDAISAAILAQANTSVSYQPERKYQV